MKLTVVITTFEHRFEKYFKPLLASLATQYRDGCEIVVVVNAENGVGLNDDYRRNIMTLCANYSNVYLFTFPEFRGLSKLWNTGIVNSSGEYVVILNDDIAVPGNFVPILLQNVDAWNTSVLLNSSFSHFVVKRTEIDELGYFDERLLGIGEEDGDFRWRYITKYGRDLLTVNIPGIANYIDGLYDYKPTNIRTHSGMKYSLFNRVFVTEYKYEKTDEPNAVQGMFDTPMKCKLPVDNQYPYEKFRLKNKSQL
jgi:glycosyltransferase involved in cell wall biosynthesis